MSRFFLLFGVTALFVLMTTGTDGQYVYNVNTMPSALNTNPTMCTKVVTAPVQNCPNTVCYMKATVGLCCMGVYRNANGALYQQCICLTTVQCTAAVASTASTTSTTSTTTSTTTTTTPTTTTTTPTTTTTTPTRATTPTTTTTTPTTTSTTTTTPTTTTPKTTTPTTTTPTTTTAPTTTSAAPFSDTPLFCGATVSTPFCGTTDPCFNSTTRSSCCLAVQRVATNAIMTFCRCDSTVQCPAVPTLP
ncbi:unnamed protein product [Lymnaea stagnalis]|uniref:Uncharacterized protein n=1 Tax=Lymnaea stagnalis TaxID=6523 RepID=A0AAV2HQB7_LYMST